MFAERPDLAAVRVAYVVRRQWVVDINTVDFHPDGSDSWHWVLGDDDGPRWFATVDEVASDDERDVLVRAFEASAALAHALPFAVVPVHTRDARIAVDVAPGLLLSLTPYLDGTAYGEGPLPGDEARCTVAGMAGELHRLPRPRGLPVWRPQVGRHADAGATELGHCLAEETWTGGPWSVPAGRLVRDAEPVVRQALRRFALLGAAVRGHVDTWVVTHGRPHARHLLSTPDGPRLVDWSTLALAPRERDLGDALGRAEGHDPWFSYLEAGGRPDPLSPDTVELFTLQSHLSVVAGSAVRLSRPHDDSEDARRRFAELEHEVEALVALHERPADERDGRRGSERGDTASGH